MSDATIFSENAISNIDGGSSVSNDWNTRILNTANQTNNWSTLNTSTGFFNLKAGKYLITADSIGVGVGSHQLRIRNVNTGQSYYGLSNVSNTFVQSNSSVATASAYVIITSQTSFTIEHFYENSVPNFGKGLAVGAPNNTEVYSNVVIQKI